MATAAGKTEAAADRAWRSWGGAGDRWCGELRAIGSIYLNLIVFTCI
ncbi:hypothetical protein QUB19_27840 [Microcoleus sp. B4-C5]